MSGASEGKVSKSGSYIARGWRAVNTAMEAISKDSGFDFDGEGVLKGSKQMCDVIGPFS